MSTDILEKSNESLCQESVFERLFETNNQPLVRFLYYRYGDLEKAKNLAQDSFIRLWKNCKEIGIEKAKGFLYTTAKRLFLDDFAHQKVKLKFVERSKASPSTPESTDDEVRISEFKKALEEAISSLPEKQRMVFLMSRIDKMKYTEIAETLDISIKTVEKHMSQSLIKVRESIKEFGNFKF